MRAVVSERRLPRVHEVRAVSTKGGDHGPMPRAEERVGRATLHEHRLIAANGACERAGRAALRLARAQLVAAAFAQRLLSAGGVERPARAPRAGHRGVRAYGASRPAPASTLTDVRDKIRTGWSMCPAGWMEQHARDKANAHRPRQPRLHR